MNIAQNLTHMKACTLILVATGIVLLAGDFNGSLIDNACTNVVKSQMLLRFAHDCNIAIVDRDFTVHGEKYSFVQKRTMLDYIFFDKSTIDYLEHYDVPIEGSISITSDHLPVIAKFNFHIKKHKLLFANGKSPALYKATPEALENFRTRVRQHFQELKCRELKTLDDIEFYAQNLVHALHTCAAETIPMSSFNPFTRPDWTKNVKDLHDIERAKRRLWMADGRPRGMHHPSYREYKRAKRHSPGCARFQHDKYMRETYRDIDQAAECDIRLFWRLTKRKKPRSSRVYPEIRDEGGNLNRGPSKYMRSIRGIFLRKIYTPLSDDNFDSGFNDHIETEYGSLKMQSTAFEGDMLPVGTITNDDIQKLVNKLKTPQSPR